MTPIFRVFTRLVTRHNNALACDIAVRCADVVTQHIRSDTALMESAELHGYVRARAQPIVRVFVQQSLGVRSRREAPEHKLTAIALERTVQLVVRNLQSPLVIYIPSPHVPTRAAA
jgi:hypothetical protein